MKSLFVSALLLFSVNALADATVVPPYMVDAVITVKLKDGREYKFSGNTHAVVLRSSSNKLKDPVVVEKIVEKVVEVEVEKIVEVEKAEPAKEINKNRARLGLGAGPTGLRAHADGDAIEVAPQIGPVGALGYDRLLNDKISVGGQVMTNGTATIGLGLDF